jgi:hypothetical protein
VASRAQTHAGQPVTEQSRHGHCRCRRIAGWLNRRRWCSVDTFAASRVAFLGDDTLRRERITKCPGCGYGHRFTFGRP